MDSLTLTLASFIQRYLAEAQDNISVLEKWNLMSVYDNKKMKVVLWLNTYGHFTLFCLDLRNVI